MAAPVCVLHRTLIRSRGGPNQASCPSVCRDLLYVMDVYRYTRDPGFSLYFPHSVLQGMDLYDAILTDGDCRLQVTLDPSLNRLVERNILRCGAALRLATFSPALTAQLPQSSGASGQGRESYRLVSADVKGEDDDADGVSHLANWTSLPWFGSTDNIDHVFPLRANRTVFLPLWNNTDFNGAEWREAPPTEDDDEEAVEVRRPSITVSELRSAFLSRHHSVTRGAVRRQLIGRIVNKSRLVYYGKQDQNSECPYKAELELCDRSGHVCVVLWNSVCLNWYRCLKPGDIVSLTRFKVKQNYRSSTQDVEISVNSRNPTAQFVVLPESSVPLRYRPPAPEFTFYNSLQLLEQPHGVICDVIGLLMFSGRPERIRSKDAHGAEVFLAYRWLRLEDGSSDRPIMVKLFSTSQPDVQHRLHPLCVIVCSRVKIIRVDKHLYLRNTSYTQVYCTGQGHHSVMAYRKLRPVRDFIRWVRCQDDRHMQSRALVGGFFVYPPPPVSLETFMKQHRGAPNFLQGAELQEEMERLCYRERQTFCMQATVTMVIHCRTGQEDRCLYQTIRPSPVPSSSSCPGFSKPSPSLSSSSSLLPPLCSSSSSPFPPASPSSSVNQLRSRTPGCRSERCVKRRLSFDSPRKRCPQVTVEPEQNKETVILFQASMEFLENTDDEDDEDDVDDDDNSSFITAPLVPTFPPVSMETLPMCYDHEHREEQALSIAMGGKMSKSFNLAIEEYYTLRLRALSGVLIDVVFLPDSTSSSLQHANTWCSILSHGAFSSHTPAPAPADLIAMVHQLTNQRMVCVLEACHLGGDRTELVLVRAFPLST